MLMDKDKEIIFHVEQYGFITIGQAFSIWLSDRRYGYDIARKHLNKIVKAGYLKSFKPVSNIYAEKIFFLEDKFARPSKSTIVCMNVYAELIRLGADIIYFKREEEWLDRKYRSDAFGIFNINQYIFSSCIEVIDSQKLTYANHKKTLSNKYEEIYSNDEPIKKILEKTNLNRSFDLPKLIIISEISKSSLEIEGIEIVNLEYSLQKLSQIFV